MPDPTTLIAPLDALDSWTQLLRGHVVLYNALDSCLRRDDRLTVNQYVALLLIAEGPDRGVRRVDLASALQLTASGVTRLLDVLQRRGFVDGGSTGGDARVKRVVMTCAGHAKLQRTTERLQSRSRAHSHAEGNCDT